MKTTAFTIAILAGLFLSSTQTATAASRATDAIVAHDPAGSEDSKAAATRVMNVLTNDGLIAGEDAAKLRDELTKIFAKSPVATGDKTKDAAAQEKVKEQVHAAVLRHMGKDKDARVSELLAKTECWEAKACAKGKSCCAGHK